MCTFKHFGVAVCFPCATCFSADAQQLPHCHMWPPVGLITMPELTSVALTLTAAAWTDLALSNFTATLTEEAQKNPEQAALAPPSASHLIFNGLGEYSLILIRALANVTHTVALAAQAHRQRVNDCRESVHSISLRETSQK